MLAWHVIWMARHSQAMAADLRAVGQAVREGISPVSALSVVVGVAVLREGAELALFLYGIAISGGADRAEMLAGGATGFILAAGLTAATYAGLVSLPARRLFAVTGGLVTLLAAGLAAQAAGLLQQGGMVTALDATVWDSSAMLAEASLPGRILHTLIGYSDRPSTLQLLAYLATMLVIAGLARAMAPARRLGQDGGRRDQRSL
jgi:high-affinity iron transporter